MSLIPYYLQYLSEICEGTRQAPEGLALSEQDDLKKALQLQAGIAEMGIPAFVRACAAQDGTLTLTDSDGSTQSGTYTLTQRDANNVLYDLTLDGETGTALVGVTEYTDAAGEKSSEYTLILSLPERTVYFRADMAQ